MSEIYIKENGINTLSDVRCDICNKSCMPTYNPVLLTEKVGPMSLKIFKGIRICSGSTEDDVHVCMDCWNEGL